MEVQAARVLTPEDINRQFHWLMGDVQWELCLKCWMPKPISQITDLWNPHVCHDCIRQAKMRADKDSHSL